eukprot:ctg_5793.g481
MRITGRRWAAHRATARKRWMCTASLVRRRRRRRACRIRRRRCHRPRRARRQRRRPPPCHRLCGTPRRLAAMRMPPCSGRSRRPCRWAATCRRARRVRVRAGGVGCVTPARTAAGHRGKR